MSMPLLPEDDFVPMRGFQSANAQTVLAALLPAPSVSFRRERWDTPDGDFVDVDWLPAPADAPHVLMLHGLEGSSQAAYVRRLSVLAAERGWGAVALNFRSCSGELNRLARSYNAGDTGDAAFVVKRLRSQLNGPLLAAGYSLGGSVLAGLLAELGDAAPLTAAALVSVPFDLDACAQRLDAAEAWSRLYRAWFLKTLLRKAWGKHRRHPGLLKASALLGVRTLRGYDDVVTAPLHGFADAAEYYARSSSGPKLLRIRTPTLIVSSEDDPLAPAAMVPNAARSYPALQLALSPRGGHVGFVGGWIGRPRYWADGQIVRFFEKRLAAVRAPGHGKGA
jgi:predicted alpha/beta-fold hydrolase